MQKLLLFDGFSILNRAFYALPLLSTRDGEYTNGVYGFMNMFFRFIDEEKPDLITVAFDLPQPTFRHEMYGAYKGTRKGMPDELRAQVPILKNLLEIMEINIAEAPGYEADDVIGTLAKKAEGAGIAPVIISGDRDLLQLATDTVRIRIPKTQKGKTEVEDYLAADVLAKYGVSPQAFIDVKALMGDTSDNVPGVPSIGEVTATKIITAFGSLENALENAPEVKPKKASENLIAFKDQAILSKELVTIALDAPVDLSTIAPENMFNPQATAEIKRLELKTLYKRFEGDSAPPEPTREINITTITDAPTAHNFFSTLGDAAMYPIWEDGTLLAISISTADTHTYIATGHGELQLFAEPGMATEDLLQAAKPWLETENNKIIYDYKNQARKFISHGINLQSTGLDLMLAPYILDPLQPNTSPANIAYKYLGEQLPTLEDLLDNKGKRGKQRKAIKDLDLTQMAQYATTTADAMFRLSPIVVNLLTINNQLDLYQNIEIPVAKTLLQMEMAGIPVDANILTAYGEALNARLTQLTAEIYHHAEETFNINSPSQLGVILFEKLGLKGGKKTTQGYSTAADILEKLKDKHPIIAPVLEYRAHAKLKSTYVDGLLPLINPTTGRVHSTFNQALTATGRLSSAEPNLQNIPIRMPLGRELRKAFVAKAGHVFLAADYSQIELRLLAHMSGDDTLINAFLNDIDIHRLTASQVLGVAPEDVTDLERSRAKAVNFGIVYGISAYSLSEDIGSSIAEAEAYISGYFRQYPGVKGYLDKTIADAKDLGYVATLYNRRRAMAEFKSSNFNIRSFGERVAMNMPLQGSAADIIKIAMVNVQKALTEGGFKAQLILQVHDELMLEVPVAEVPQVRKILQEEMQNAVQLDVPLIAEVNEGGNWYDTK